MRNRESVAKNFGCRNAANAGYMSGEPRIPRAWRTGRLRTRGARLWSAIRGLKVRQAEPAPGERRQPAITMASDRDFALPRNPLPLHAHLLQPTHLNARARRWFRKNLRAQ